MSLTVTDFECDHPSDDLFLAVFRGNKFSPEEACMLISAAVQLSVMESLESRGVTDVAAMQKEVDEALGLPSLIAAYQRAVFLLNRHRDSFGYDVQPIIDEMKGFLAKVQN